MLDENVKQLSSETQKQISIAARNGNAGEIAQLIFRSFGPKPPEQPDPPGINFTIWDFQPDPLKLPKDIFDELDVASFYCDNYQFLDEKELNASIALYELVSVAAKSGAFESAWNISERIKQPGKRERAREVIISEYIAAGEMEAAFGNYLRLECNTNRILNLLCRIADFQFSARKNYECLRTINEILKTSYSEHLFDRDKFRSRVALLQAKLDEFDSALETIQTIEEEDLKAVALSRIAVILAKAGNRERSADCFVKALVEAESIKYSPNRFKVMQKIIEAQAEAGWIEAAVSTAKSLKWDAERAVYSDRILADGLPDDYWGCRVCGMQRCREEFEELTTRDKGMGRVAEIQARSGDFDGAMKTVKLIEWPTLYAEALFLVGKANAENGNSALAKENFASSLAACVECHCRNQPAFLRDLALEQARIGDIENALATAHFIDCEVSKAEVLTKIGEIQGQTEGWAASKEVFNEAIKAANNIDYGDWRIDALLKIGLSLSEFGRKEEAQRVFASASKQAATAEHLSWKVGLFLRIAAALLKSGEREEAQRTLGVARDFAEKANDVEQIKNVAVALAKNGLKEAVTASEAIAATPALWPHVASVFAKQGDLENFIRMLLLGSYDWVTAQKVCVLLGQAFPDQVEAIADVVFQFLE